jgi:hypothetical protein
LALPSFCALGAWPPTPNATGRRATAAAVVSAAPVPIFSVISREI